MRRGRVPEVGLLLMAYQLLQNIGINNLPPVTLLAIITQVSIYLQFLVVPRLCISGESVYHHGDFLRLVIPALRHTHDIHLYYNVVSLAWKGISLERRLGSVKFFITLLLLTILSSAIYVGLAVFASELFNDFSYMRQCAIGFSGVLFALKVLATHYDHNPWDSSSYFGFSVPVRYGVWLELLIIHIVVPNSSFLGHLAGIIAGVLFIKGPIHGILSLFSPPAIRSVFPSTSISLFLCAAQTILHLGLVPGWKAHLGCLPTRQHMTMAFKRLSALQVKSMLSAPLYHMSNYHLVFNLISFLVKGRKLEQKLGVFRFLLLVAECVLFTSLVYIIMARSWFEFSGDSSHISHCVVGISGALFALKVFSIYHSASLDLTLLFELGELVMLVESNYRWFHIAGLITGLLLLFLSNRRERHVWGHNGRVLGTGIRQQTRRQTENHEGWTRSWGYAGHSEPPRAGNQYLGDEEMDEMMERSRRSYEEEQNRDSRGFTPTAPPESVLDHIPEDAAHPPPRRYHHDGSGSNPPPRRYHPDDPAPTPPGDGFQRFGSTASPEVPNIEELRRRRLERFS